MVGATACQCVGGGGPARTTLLLFLLSPTLRGGNSVRTLQSSRLQSCGRYLAMRDSPTILLPVSPVDVLDARFHLPTTHTHIHTHTQAEQCLAQGQTRSTKKVHG